MGRVLAATGDITKMTADTIVKDANNSSDRREMLLCLLQYGNMRYLLRSIKTGN